MKFVVALALLAAVFAAPSAKQSGYCHTSWWPAACDLISNGNCIGNEYPAGGYATEADCIGYVAASDTPSPSVQSASASPSPSLSLGWCHTSWNPEACDLISSGNCVGNEYPAGGFTSEDECLGVADSASPSPSPSVVSASASPSPSMSLGWCHTSWDPETCELISGGNCISNEYPAGGFTSEDECLGVADSSSASPSPSVVSASPSPSPSLSLGWCHSSFWPEECDLISNGNCVGSEYPAGGYATEADCLVLSSTPSASPSPVAATGYCHTSWWPETCDLISSGNCIANEYPAGGYATEAECLVLSQSPSASPSPSVMSASPSPTASPVFGYCHTSWWPETCGLVTDGNCIGNEYGTYGFATEDECLIGSSTSLTTGYCVTQIYPIVCGDASTSTCTASTTRYTDEATCLATATYYTGNAGFCVTAWWPATCGAVSGGGCVTNYPPYGYATQAECEASFAKSATKMLQDMQKASN